MGRATILILGGALLGCSATSHTDSTSTAPDTGAGQSNEQGGAAGAANPGMDPGGRSSLGGSSIAGGGGDDQSMRDASLPTADGAPGACNSPQVVDAMEAQRAACSFK